MKLKDKYEVEILRMDHQGRGIGIIFDKIIFVPKTLIGEKVEVKITTVKKKYLEGEVIQVIQESSKRVNPPCPYFNECGGCDLMHMPYEEQLKYKENKVKDIFHKFTTIDPNIITNIILADDIYHYRNKIVLQVNEKIGFYKKKTTEMVEINECLISDKAINEMIKKLYELKSLDNIENVMLKASKFTDEKMIVFYTNGDVDEKDIVDKFKDEVTSIIKYDNEEYKVLYGSNYIIEKMKDLKFMISPTAFFQVNTKQAIKLYDLVLKYADLKGDEIVWDLYCGTGTIGMYLSPYCKKVIGVELNCEAIHDANRNKKLNGIDNIEFICGDVTEIVSNLKENSDIIPDIVIVDPPRPGLTNKVVKNLKKINAKKIVYVSCNPLTLARDLEKLKEIYNIEKITPVDMFINTYHVETVCLMSRK